jgi:hypothetical protein
MILYKFYKFDYGVQALLSDKIKLTTLEEINDPYELKGVKIGKGGIADLYKPHELFSDTLFACFSRDYSSPIMWSHYADIHKGMVVGYEYIGNKKVIEVKYRNAMRKFPKKPVNLGEYLAEIKFKKWDYEEESRILFSTKDIKPSYNNQVFYYFIKNNEYGFAVKEVIYGFNSDVIKIKKLHGLLDKRIAQFKSELNDDKFVVDRYLF